MVVNKEEQEHKLRRTRLGLIKKLCC